LTFYHAFWHFLTYSLTFYQAFYLTNIPLRAEGVAGFVVRAAKQPRYAIAMKYSDVLSDILSGILTIYLA
jgi:hypothetical protein